MKHLIKSSNGCIVLKTVQNYLSSFFEDQTFNLVEIKKTGIIQKARLNV